MTLPIRATVGLRLVNGSLKYQFPTTDFSVGMSGNKMVSSVQDLTTTPSLINVNGATFTPGFSLFTNLGSISGQYVYVAASSGGIPMIKLNGGEPALLPIYSLTLWANTSSGSGTIGTNIIGR